tara:strand:+ start:684 stop:791 length:108 start_codon:yes stop_codon:yes gene_type:complete
LKKAAAYFLPSAEKGRKIWENEWKIVKKRVVSTGN